MQPKIDHIGIIVRNLDNALRLYGYLGLAADKFDTVGEEFQARMAFVPIGESTLEFILPLEPGRGLIAELLAQKGEGIHHIALRVDNIDDTLTMLKQRGVPLQNKEPRRGSRGTKVAFIDPEATNSVLVELVEHPE